MIKSLLKVALILIVGILVYNRYLGTDTEKAQAKEVFSSVKGVVKSVAGIVRTEKDKFDAGKYDKVVDKLGGVYRTIREKAQFLDDKVLGQLSDLEKRKKALEEELADLQAEDSTSESDNKGLRRDSNSDEINASKEASKKQRQEKLRKEMDQLLKETQELLEEAEREQEQ